MAELSREKLYGSLETLLLEQVSIFERTRLIKFVMECFKATDDSGMRSVCIPLCTWTMLNNIGEVHVKRIVERVGQFGKLIRAGNKKYEKLDKTLKESALQAHFLPIFIEDFISFCNIEIEEISSDTESVEALEFAETVLEFFVVLVSQLATRRPCVPLLESTHFVTRVRLSKIMTLDTDFCRNVAKWLELLDSFINVSIDDATGVEISSSDMEERYGFKIRHFQKVCLKTYEKMKGNDDTKLNNKKVERDVKNLFDLALMTNSQLMQPLHNDTKLDSKTPDRHNKFNSIENSYAFQLIKALNPSILLSLCAELNLVDPQTDERLILQSTRRHRAAANNDLINLFDRQVRNTSLDPAVRLAGDALKILLASILLSFIRPPQLIQKNSLTNSPIYATERELWDPLASPPPSHADVEVFRALPALNLQFLTFSDYLWRNLVLRQMETFYALRSDIELAVRRLSPQETSQNTREPHVSNKRRPLMLGVRNSATLQIKCDPSGQAIPMTSFGVTEVRQPQVGKSNPSLVSADLSVDLECLNFEARTAWDTDVRRGSVLYLLALREGLRFQQDEDNQPQLAAAKTIQSLSEKGKGKKRDDETEAGLDDGADVLEAIGGVDGEDLEEVELSSLLATEPGNQKEGASNARGQVASKIRAADEAMLAWPMQWGLVALRGCKVEMVADVNGNHIGKVIRDAATGETKIITELEGSVRNLTIHLDPVQFYSDQSMDNGSSMEALYANFNVVLRRDPRSNGDTSLLTTVRLLCERPHEYANNLPDWFTDVLMGYGDPLSTHHSSMHDSRLREFILPANIIKDAMHARETLSPLGEFAHDIPDNLEPPFKVSINFPFANDLSTRPLLSISSHQSPLSAPPLFSSPTLSTPSLSSIKFSSSQVASILSGLNLGLTLVEGPPGTGKTDVAAACIQALLANFPHERIVVVAHSNRALNELFSKVARLPGVHERHLVRLGGGAEELSLDGKDFSKQGRVDFLLARRLEYLPLVSRLVRSLGVSGHHSATCETAANFYKLHIAPRIAKFNKLSKEIIGDGSREDVLKGIKILMHSWPAVYSELMTDSRNIKFLLEQETYLALLASRSQAEKERMVPRLGRSAQRRAKKKAALIVAASTSAKDTEMDADVLDRVSDNEGDDNSVLENDNDNLTTAIKRKLNLVSDKVDDNEEPEDIQEENTASLNVETPHINMHETIIPFEEMVLDPEFTTAFPNLASLDDLTSFDELNAHIHVLLSVIFPFSRFIKESYGLPLNEPLLSTSASPLVSLRTLEGYLSSLQDIFASLEDCRPFEIMHSAKDREAFLIQTQARVISMTCAYAAAHQCELADRIKFSYDSLIIEEAAQISEVETIIPFLLQKHSLKSNDSHSSSRLKRVLMLGDINQLPPIVTCQILKSKSHLDQSMFSRLQRLGVPKITLNAQGRSRPEIFDLFRGIYLPEVLEDLPRVRSLRPFQLPNAMFSNNVDFIQVAHSKEVMPKPNAFANLLEAEFAVGLFMLMRLANYPANRISILTPYKAQKALISEVIRQRCGSSPIFSRPGAVETIDRYQGQQNDFVILSLTRSRGSTLGHLQDFRRLLVSLSRAALGLYILGNPKAIKDAANSSESGSSHLKLMCENLLRMYHADGLELRMDESFPMIRSRANSNPDAVRKVLSTEELWKILDLKVKERLEGLIVGSLFMKE